MNVLNTRIWNRFLSFLEKWYLLFLFFILLLASFNLFYNLGVFPIYSWDEARHGVNAYEMMKRHNYIVNTYAYKNDYWNLKPPLSFWSILLGYKLVGTSTLGLRFFSALAALTTIGIIALFTLYNSGRLASLFSATVLSTSTPFILEHCGRTGDADALFVLFYTLSILSIYLINAHSRWLYIAGLSFGFAFLAKSWHAGTIIIIQFLYCLFSRTLFTLKKRQILLFILSCAFPILVWAVFRYSQDGFTFFKTMIGYDLISRTCKTLEGHIGTVYFYLEILQSSHFYWFVLFISTILTISALIPQYIIETPSKNYIFLLLLWIVTPFFLYTCAKTKISWYILPLYPAIAITIGSASSFLLKGKHQNFILQTLLLLLFFFSAYKNQYYITQQITAPKPELTQQLLKKIETLPQYKGKPIYIHHFEQSYWLCAEFYGDMIPKEGGVEGFLKEKDINALLLVRKDTEDALKNVKNPLKILFENESAYIFMK